jgi:predicted acyl esterase
VQVPTTDTPLYRLRIHGTQEWHDLYQRENLEDFRKFLDFYMKGVQNGWESTPKVRTVFLRYNQVRDDVFSLL